MGARLAAGFLLPEIRYLPATAGAGLPAPAGLLILNHSSTMSRSFVSADKYTQSPENTASATVSREIA